MYFEMEETYWLQFRGGWDVLRWLGFSVIFYFS